MPADWSVTPQDQNSAVITPVSPESLSNDSWIWGSSNFSSSTWPGANTALYVPFSIYVPTKIVAAGPYNGATATGNFDVGIYDDQGNRLVSLGSTAQSGTTAWQVNSIGPITLDPGNYYKALVFSSASSTVLTLITGNATMARMAGVLQQTSALPLPATATFAVATFGKTPLFALSTRTWI